jgi:hypothetical protein
MEFYGSSEGLGTALNYNSGKVNPVHDELYSNYRTQLMVNAVQDHLELAQSEEMGLCNAFTNAMTGSSFV